MAIVTFTRSLLTTWRMWIAFARVYTWPRDTTFMSKLRREVARIKYDLVFEKLRSLLNTTGNQIRYRACNCGCGHSRTFYCRESSDRQSRYPSCVPTVRRLIWANKKTRNKSKLCITWMFNKSSGRERVIFCVKTCEACDCLFTSVRKNICSKNALINKKSMINFCIVSHMCI